MSPVHRPRRGGADQESHHGIESRGGGTRQPGVGSRGSPCRRFLTQGEPEDTLARNDCMTVIAVVPARYASVRFPGKPLAPLAGRPMVVHVLDAARSAARVDRALVATDDARIADCVRAAGGEAVLTSREAQSGTDRVAEIARHVAADVYVNVQGDEPLMAPENTTQ